MEHDGREEVEGTTASASARETGPGADDEGLRRLIARRRILKAGWAVPVLLSLEARTALAQVRTGSAPPVHGDASTHADAPHQDANVLGQHTDAPHVDGPAHVDT